MRFQFDRKVAPGQALVSFVHQFYTTYINNISIYRCIQDNVLLGRKETSQNRKDRPTVAEKCVKEDVHDV